MFVTGPVSDGGRIQDSSIGKVQMSVQISVKSFDLTGLE